MRTAYLNKLYELAQKDKNVLSLVADNGMIVYDDFRENMPEQYFNFGISEGHMVTAAAGMASCGKIPFVYTISSFLAYRAYEFIRVDVCLQNLNVKIVGIGSGVSYGYLGPTHHATEDIPLLRSLPNLTIFSPGSPIEAKKAIETAYEINGPVYVRLGTNGEREIHDEDFSFKMGKGAIIQEGSDICLITTGAIIDEVIQAATMLQRDGLSVKVVSMHTLKPFDEDMIISLAEHFDEIYTIEEHTIVGGLGGIVAEIIANYGLDLRLRMIGLLDRFAVGYGTIQEVRIQNGLDAKSIYMKIVDNMNKV